MLWIAINPNLIATIIAELSGFMESKNLINVTLAADDQVKKSQFWESFLKKENENVYEKLDWINKSEKVKIRFIICNIC